MHVNKHNTAFGMWGFLLVFLCSGVAAQVTAPVTENRTSSPFKLLTPDTAAIGARIQYAREIQDAHPDTALLILQQTWQDSRSTGYTQGVARSLLSLGKVYTTRADYDEALHLWQEGIKSIYLGGGDRRLLSQFYNNMGVIYNIKGQYPESLSILTLGLSLAKSFPDNDQTIGITYNSIATVYMNMPNTPAEKKAYYLEKAVSHALKANDSKLLSGALANLGTVYTQQMDWQKSKVLFDSALSIARQKDLVEAQYSLLLSLAELYLSKQKPLESLQYLKQVQRLDNRGVNPYYRMLTDLNSGEAYAQLKDHQRALLYMTKAEDAARSLGTLSNQSKVYQGLSRLYTQMGNYKEALGYYQKYAAVNDSILQQNSVNYIAEMDVKYKSAQKENELTRNRFIISEQHSRLSRNNLFIALALTCIVLLVLLLLITIKISKQRRKIILKEKSIGNLKSMIAGEEKERIRISKELHDGIGGMLAAIKYSFHGLIKDSVSQEKEKMEHLKSMLETVSGEVRAVAHNLAPDAVMRFGLKKTLEQYCANHAGPQLDINLQFHGNLDLLDTSYELMIYRMVQELLQNAIKHASASHIDIQVMEYDRHINLTFEDNGVGFDTDEAHRGIGLQNIRARVEALQGSLSIVASEQRGTTVHLYFPITVAVQS
jgi:signal transduction histidine kinase